jgi:hypothetical protein
LFTVIFNRLRREVPATLVVPATADHGDIVKALDYRRFRLRQGRPLEQSAAVGNGRRVGERPEWEREAAAGRANRNGIFLFSDHPQPAWQQPPTLPKPDHWVANKQRLAGA